MKAIRLKVQERNMKKSLVCLFAAASAAFAQENYSTTWTQHKNIVINSVAAALTFNVTGFPLLVRLDSTQAAIFTQAKTGGADLRFTKADNTTRLPHQIESWNATTKTATIWVLVDTVKANISNQALRMHWGNSAAADSSNGAQVFKTSGGFQAVWHMNGTADETDATSNGITATAVVTPASANGRVGPARQFTGTEYFRATGSAGGPLNFAFNSNFTLSAWINPVELAAHGVIVSKHDLDYALKLDQNNTLEFFQFVNTSGWNAVNSPAGQNEWLHAVAVQKGDSSLLYINGALVDNEPTLTPGGGTRREDVDVVVGAEPTSNTAVRRFFIGVIDELRMSNVARPADWARLDYANQVPGQTIVTLVDSVPPPATVPGAPTGVTAVNGTAALSVNVTWVAPANNGGAPITAYKANAVSDTAKNCTVAPPALTCTITGLPVATYTFVVRAINGVGSSAPSTASAPVTTGIARGFAALSEGFSALVRNGAVTFSLPASASAGRIVISDLHGRQVWSRNVDGNGRVSWNGLLANGRPMNSGIYTVRFVSQDSRTWKSVLDYTR
jgi:hypothetical protein